MRFVYREIEGDTRRSDLNLYRSLALQHAESEYALYHKQERQAEHLESIRELDRDLKALKK